MRAVSSEFLRAIRGERSQVAFARRLGYRGNPVADWEHGRRFPTAREALRACARVGLDVPAAFARFHPTAPLQADARGAPALGPWLDALRGSRPVAELAAAAGHSRFALARYFSGRAEPRVPAFFEVVDALTGRLPDLVAELVSIDRVPSLRARFLRARAARSLAHDEPWTEAVLRVLESPAYQSLEVHVPGVIARRLGLDAATEARALRLLTRAGLVRRRAGRYRVAGTLTVDTRATPEATARLRAHWSRVAAARAAELHAADHHAYNVVSVSARDLERVEGVLRDAYREIRSIVAASEPPDEVALVLLELVVWRDGQPAGLSPAV